jgi:hypothetical protein
MFMLSCIVTCDRASWQIFLIIKPTRCTNLSNLFWKWNSTCFGQFLCPSSGVIHCTLRIGICHTDSFRAAAAAAAGSGWNCSYILILLLLLESCLQTCMTYTNAVCTVNNCWWWTEELSETCRVSFQNKFEKLAHLVGFIIRYLRLIRAETCNVLKYCFSVNFGYFWPHSWCIDIY